MFCCECGKKINNEDKFCPNCGKKQILNQINKSKKDLKNNNEILVDSNIKNFEEYEEKEFNKLNDETKRKIILQEISFTNKYHWRFEKLNLLLEKFDLGYFKKTNEDFSIYELLKDDNYLSEYLSDYCKTTEKSILEKSAYYFFLIWILNTSLANGLGAIMFDGKWEGWYIPALSEVTPMIVQELTILEGKGDFRMASQAEVWRTNRRLRKLKDNINKIEENFEELLN